MRLAAKVAIYAVVRLARNVAGVSSRIYFHMQMPALEVVAAFTLGRQREVAPDDDAYLLLGTAAEFDDGTGFRPDDFQRRPIPRMR